MRKPGEAQLQAHAGRRWRTAPLCLLLTCSRRRTGRPSGNREGRSPEAQGPEEDRDEVLNPAMQRVQTERRRRQMGGCGVDEDTDQDVNHNEQALGAEEGLHIVHFSSLPLCGRWKLLCDPASSNDSVASPRRLRPSSTSQDLPWHVSRIVRMSPSATMTPRRCRS